MTNTIVNEMVEKINAKIKRANETFKITGWNHSHELRMATIDGMVDMLVIITGKDYVITENGLVER